MNLKRCLWIAPLVVLLSLNSAQVELLAAATNEPFLSRVRQLTYEGKRSGEGYFSPDGKALIFQSEREPDNPFYQIYLLDLESGDSHRVSPGIGKTTCSFFRPGRDEVLFASTHADPEARQKQSNELAFRASGQERRYAWDYDEQMELFTAQRDGTHLRRLTDSPGYDAEGAYSPDGSKIVFCSLRSAFPTNQLAPAELKRLETDPSWFGEIYLMNADGSEPRRLTHTPGYDGGPFFSPDGRRIIWRRFDEAGLTADVFTMNLDGTDVQRITDFGAMSWAPFYHPSGRYIIFTSNKLGFGNFELFLVDVTGQKQPVRVTFTDGFDGLPVFAPDGARLCWTSGRGAAGKSQLFMADWDHSAALAALGEAPTRIPATTNRTATLGSNKTEPPVTTPKLTPAITTDDFRSEISHLASQELQGRMTGSAGARAAADYLATVLSSSGLQPAGENGTYFQSFTFNAGTQIVTNRNEFLLRVSGKPPERFDVEKDFRPLSFTDNGTVEGEVVFAGYGLSVPGKPGEGYDSYAGLNVSNKIILALRYVPEDVPAQRRQELNRYAGLRYKAMLAREHGAQAILFVSGPQSPNAGELIPLSFDSSLAGSGIVALSISSNIAQTLLTGSGRNLQVLQKALDNENPHAEAGFALSNLTIRVVAAVEHIKKTDRNVLATLAPTSGPAGSPAQYIVIGAHYDHLGRGEAGAMLQKGDEDKVHPGADDNASGTATVLELAAALAANKERLPLSRGFLFAFWSGEEIGLIGSSHFVAHPTLPLSNIAACVNFDMVGRLRDNKLTLQGIGSSGSWWRWIEKRNVAAGFDLVLQDDPYLPTDVTAFYPKEIPVINFFTGSHDEYHRPTDTPESLNYDGLKRVAEFARGLLMDIAQAAQRPDYVKVERSTPAAGTRENLRAYLGTIPDYTTELAGVKLSGVRGASPADKAGLKGGDVIVEFAGQKIANIYDYTFALDAVKIGQPVKLAVLRDGKKIEMTVVPEARK